MKNFKIKMYTVIGLSVFTLLLSCVTSEKSSKEKNDKNLYGSWRLNNPNQINYPELYFRKDSTSVFSSRGDTLYRFKYKVLNSKLYLTDLEGRKNSFNIVLLNNDSLVFSSLLENQEKQVYLKVNE